MQVAESELGKLYDEEWNKWYSENDEGFDPNTRSMKEYWKDEFGDEFDEQYGGDDIIHFGYIDAYFGWLGEWGEDQYYPDGRDPTYSDRAVNVIKNIFATKRLLRALHAWGPEKAAQIQHLRITWGEDEYISDFFAAAGPTSLSIMSLIAKVWLKGLTYLQLREVDVTGKHNVIGKRCKCFSQPQILGLNQDNWSKQDKWEKFGADGPLRNWNGSDVDYKRMITALDLLEKCCPKVIHNFIHWNIELTRCSFLNFDSKIGISVTQMNGLLISGRKKD
jgi:hypothetical protein